MPKRKAAVKQERKDRKRHAHNLKIKTELKKAVKKFQQLIVAKNAAEAKTVLTKVFSLLDKAAKKNVIHKNKASRDKSRFSSRLAKAA
ncbi:MAG: 30S ribosomal protein S20 [Deltaproteobacteria bacterium]